MNYLIENFLIFFIFCLRMNIFNLVINIHCQKDRNNIYKSMSLDTTMVSIHPHFTIKDGKMDQCIALLEEILLLTKSKEPDFLFFNITKCCSDKAQVREAYRDVPAALFHLKNMGHMIPKLFEVADINVQVHGPAKEIEPLKEILKDADFYEAISGF